MGLDYLNIGPEKAKKKVLDKELDVASYSCSFSDGLTLGVQRYHSWPLPMG